MSNRKNITPARLLWLIEWRRSRINAREIFKSVRDAWIHGSGCVETISGETDRHVPVEDIYATPEEIDEYQKTVLLSSPNSMIYEGK